MQTPLDQAALEAIKKNGTFLAVLSLGQSYVSLVGDRNSQTQEYQWSIFIGEPQGQPIAMLSCPLCDIVVITADRMCHKCNNFCSVELRKKLLYIENSPLELHRLIQSDPLVREMPGVRVSLNEPQSSSVPSALPPDFPLHHLEVGVLYCPKGHGFRAVTGDGTGGSVLVSGGGDMLLHDRWCQTHGLRLDAVLVRRDGVAIIERRAYDRSGDDVTFSAFESGSEVEITALHCPKCDTLITHRSLRCVTCKNVIIDVGLQAHPPALDGHDRKNIIKIVRKPRSVFDTHRPDGLLKMEGDDWVSSVKTKVEASPTRSIQKEQTEIDEKALFDEAFRLIDDENVSYSEVLERLGISSRGKLQTEVNKRREQAERQKFL